MYLRTNSNLDNIEVIAQNGIDINLITEYSKNILKHIAQKSIYNKVVISSTARTPKRQAEIMYDNIVRKGMQEQRRTYKIPGQKVLDTYEVQKKSNKNKEEIIQAMTNTINEVGASNVSKHGNIINLKYGECKIDNFTLHNEIFGKYIKVAQ